MKQLPAVAGPGTIAAYAEALAILDECLAEALAFADVDNATAEEFSRVAQGLRALADKLKTGGTGHQQPNEGLFGQPTIGCGIDCSGN